MKIAIHHTPESFSDNWLQYCRENKVEFKIVNCYNSDIITQLQDCNGLMWHWNHNDYRAPLFARQLTTSLEKKGIKVFPNAYTAWHFDDKVGQKYLLESINAPFVPSYVFYSKKDALNWINTTKFPKVFKLRVGAGSSNVRLVKTKAEAISLTKKAFGGGFSSVNRLSRLKDRLWVFERDKNRKAIRGIATGVARVFIPTEVEKFSSNQKGYIYFQDFMPGNDYDSRIVIIGNRGFGFRRYCRRRDFRASGSGIEDYNPALIDKKCLEVAFQTARKLKTQSIAFDFIFENNEPKIIEMSYCFGLALLNTSNCPGYWDTDFNWHENVNPTYFIIENFLKEIQSQILPTYPA